MINWLSINDYAIKNKVSPSTVRRKIKANKLKHKIEKGKYLVPDDGTQNTKELKKTYLETREDLLKEKDHIIKLQKDFIISLREQVTDLKMLIKMLEERIY